MNVRTFLRGQFDRPATEYGTLFAASCAALCAGYFAFMGGLYAGLPDEDLAREQGLLLTLIDPAVVLVSLPLGLLLVPVALGVSLLLPRHALERAWLSTYTLVLIAITLLAWTMGPIAILHIAWVAPLGTALAWVAFPARARA